MIKVKVYKEKPFPVSTPEIKKSLRLFLEKQGIVSEAEVSVAIVGEEKIMKLAKDFLKEKDTIHNVLSFPAKEVRGEFLEPQGIINLGEIVVCYPKARQEAEVEGSLVEEKIIELVNHGALHLMGIHHK
jgi:probable rRNA maturation factor